MFSTIAASSFKVYRSGGVTSATDGIAVDILTPIEGETVTLTVNSKLTFKIVNCTGLNITELAEGQTLTPETKFKFKIQ